MPQQAISFVLRSRVAPFAWLKLAENIIPTEKRRRAAAGARARARRRAEEEEGREEVEDDS